MLPGKRKLEESPIRRQQQRAGKRRAMGPEPDSRHDHIMLIINRQETILQKLSETMTLLRKAIVPEIANQYTNKFQYLNDTLSRLEKHTELHSNFKNKAEESKKLINKLNRKGLFTLPPLIEEKLKVLENELRHHSANMALAPTRKQSAYLANRPQENRKTNERNKSTQTKRSTGAEIAEPLRELDNILQQAETALELHESIRQIDEKLNKIQSSPLASVNGVFLYSMIQLLRHDTSGSTRENTEVTLRDANKLLNQKRHHHANISNIKNEIRTWILERREKQYIRLLQNAEEQTRSKEVYPEHAVALTFLQTCKKNILNHQFERYKDFRKDKLIDQLEKVTTQFVQMLGNRRASDLSLISPDILKRYAILTDAIDYSCRQHVTSQPPISTPDNSLAHKASLNTLGNAQYLLRQEKLTRLRHVTHQIAQTLKTIAHHPKQTRSPTFEQSRFLAAHAVSTNRLDQELHDLSRQIYAQTEEELKRLNIVALKEQQSEIKVKRWFLDSKINRITNGELDSTQLEQLSRDIQKNMSRESDTTQQLQQLEISLQYPNQGYAQNINETLLDAMRNESSIRKELAKITSELHALKRPHQNVIQSTLLFRPVRPQTPRPNTPPTRNCSPKTLTAMP